MKQSAGIVLYKWVSGQLNILLAHPGGPFWKNKDLGAWSIPKGEFNDNEVPLEAAIREFEEETGLRLEGNFINLDFVRQKSGKVVFAWAIEGDFDTTLLKSNNCEIEWPSKSGKKITIPEIDRAEWYSIPKAYEKINTAQKELVERLILKL